jgi:hypothetical protein
VTAFASAELHCYRDFVISTETPSTMIDAIVRKTDRRLSTNCDCTVTPLPDCPAVSSGTEHDE